MSWFCIILHLQHCLEEKTQNFTRACQSSTRQVDVLCEARRCSSSYKCSAGNTYAELQTRTKQVWEADYVIRTQLFRCEKNHHKKENCLVENAHQEEESFFSFSVLLIYINIIILSRGSIILISRGLRGGSYFKSE